MRENERDICSIRKLFYEALKLLEGENNFKDEKMLVEEEDPMKRWKKLFRDLLNIEEMIPGNEVEEGEAQRE